MYPKLATLLLAFLLAGCATSPGRSNPERAVVFSGNALPRCEFALVQEITASVSVKGDRKMAEEMLHRELARIAERRGGDGVLGISIKAPERVPFVVSSGRRPSAADLPPVEWSARAHAIRFTDPACRT